MSLITSHHSKYNNEKVWNTVNIKMWHRDMKWTNAVGKMAPTDLLRLGYHEHSLCKKKEKSISTKCYKVKHKKQGLPISMCMHAKSPQLCLTLCNPMDCSPPGSSVHGILQTEKLEWVAMASSISSQTQISLSLSLFFLKFQEILFF